MCWMIGAEVKNDLSCDGRGHEEHQNTRHSHESHTPRLCNHRPSWLVAGISGSPSKHRRRHHDWKLRSLRDLGRKT